MRRLPLALILVLTSIAVGLSTPRSAVAASVGPRPYYLALGDSLAFGYQPNFDWSHGYADDLYAHLKPTATHYTNLGCPDETTSTFINGGCPYWYIRHTFYGGSQLTAAINFIKAHLGQVSPVTIDIGANDVLPSINSSTCAVSSSWTSALATFDTNFNTILSKLKAALAGKGDLVAMNYYDPYQNQCALNPAVMADLQVFNSHIASDAAANSVPVADVFDTFGGATTSNICSYTWMCSSYKDIHATPLGYSVIAGAFEAAEGY